MKTWEKSVFNETLTLGIENLNEEKGIISGRALTYSEKSRNDRYYKTGMFGTGEITLPALFNHDTNNVIGKVHYDRQEKFVDFIIEFNRNVEKGREAWELVKNEDITTVSIGSYITDAEWNEKKESWMMIEGELTELSLAPVPGMKNAKIKTIESLEGVKPEEKTMSKPIDISYEKLDTLNKINSEITTQKGIVTKNEMDIISLRKKMENSLNDSTEEETEKMANDIASLETTLRTSQETMLKLEDAKTAMENNRNAKIDRLKLEFSSREDVTEDKINEFCEKIQKGKAKEAIANIDDVTYQKFNDEVLAYALEHGAILKRISKTYGNDAVDVVLPVLTNDLAVVKGKLGEVDNATPQAITVGRNTLTIMEYATFVTVAVKERSMTLPEFRTWLVKSLADAIIIEHEGDVLTGAMVDGTETNSFIGCLGINTPRSIELGITKILPFDSAKTMINNVISASSFLNITGMDVIDVAMNFEDFAQMNIEMSEVINGSHMDKLMSKYNFVFSPALKPFATAVTGEASIIIGDLTTYEVQYRSSTAIQIDSTPQDRNRKSDIYAHCDALGSGVRTKAFVALTKSGATTMSAMPAQESKRASK